MNERPTGADRPYWILWTAVGGFVAVVASALWVGAGVGKWSEQKMTRVAEFHGADDGRTPSFSVADGWELRWEHDGELQEIEWIREGGGGNSFIPMPGKPIREHGSVNVVQGGQYHVEVQGAAEWKIEVNQFVAP